jgi:hypothetical protein
VESKGYEWDPKLARILSPDEDLDILLGRDPYAGTGYEPSPEGRLLHPDLAESYDVRQKELHEAAERALYRAWAKQDEQLLQWQQVNSMVQAMNMITGATMANSMSGGEVEELGVLETTETTVTTESSFFQTLWTLAPAAVPK